MNMEAILAAIDQAKAALDQIEAACANEEPKEPESDETAAPEGAPPPMPMGKNPMME